MTHANTKTLWAALLISGVLSSAGVARGQTPYVKNTTNGFESFCNGAEIPDAEFDESWSLTSDIVRPVQTNLFANCGIESIDDIGQALGVSAYLYRPSLGDPTLGDDVDGINGTALMGNVGNGVGGILITFRTPVHELYVRIVDLDDPDDEDLVFLLEDDSGAQTDAKASPGYAFANDVATLDGTFPGGVKRIELDYGDLGDNWAVDEIRFNTWDCGDGEAETAAANAENPSPEECDDANGVECDGCRTDCTSDVVGCLVDGNCVEGNGSLDPESGGCVRCSVAAPPATEVVGYNDFVSAGDTCDDDGLSCTDDQCDGAGACLHPATAGSCAIDGSCFTDGADNPDAACQFCDSASQSTAWTNRTMGTSCDDDGIACTSDLCDGAGACVHAAMAGSCLIDGSCFTDGADNPGSPCQFCDSANQSTAWTNRTMGTACDDGDACTDLTPEDDGDLGDVCNDAGECVGGEMLDCGDGLACTIDTCDPDDGCVNTLASGCLIDSAGGNPICRSAGELNPDDECTSCQPSVDERAWSVIEEGEACGDPACMEGTLTPAPTCNAAGECIDSEPVSCGGAICADAVSCDGDCTLDSECLSENYCEEGDCLPEKPPGETCDRDGECQSGQCADGVCCDAACDRVCEACNLEGSVGACTPHSVGTDPEDDCPDEPEVQVCDGSGQCIDTDYPDGTECTVAGECESGNCVDGVCCDAPCDGVCVACNLEGRAGRCEPYPMQTDPEMECEQECNGAGACVSYEVRGNGFCTANPWAPRGGSSWPGWTLLLGVGLIFWRRQIAR